MAYVIPVQLQKPKHGRGSQLLLIILTKENLERMNIGDPFDIQLETYKEYINGDLRDLDIIISYEENEEKLKELAKTGNFYDIIKYIERGRIHKKGDALPPVKV